MKFFWKLIYVRKERKKTVTVGENSGSKRIDGTDSWRDDCWDGLQRSPAELRRTAGEGAARGGGCACLVFEVFPPDWSSDVTPGWAPHGGSRWSVTQPGRQLSDSLSSLLICLVCLLFMWPCCVTKHSTWTYPKSLYVEKTGEWDLICTYMTWEFWMNVKLTFVGLTKLIIFCQCC